LSQNIRIFPETDWKNENEMKMKMGSALKM
jgi:hypothetical protein